MARSSVANRYPVQFQELADRFESDPKTPITIVLDTDAAAKTFQLEMHSFRKALRNEGAMEDYPNFGHAEVQIDKKARHQVILVDKDWTKSAIAVRNALDKLDRPER